MSPSTAPQEGADPEGQADRAAVTQAGSDAVGETAQPSPVPKGRSGSRRLTLWEKLFAAVHRNWPIRSASLNFALLYGVVFFTSATVFLSFTWWNATRLLEHHVQTSIQTEAHDMMRRWMYGGPQVVSDSIEHRLDQNVDEDALYLLVTPEGQKLAGNLPGWPPGVTSTHRFYETTVRRYSFVTQALLHAYNLPDGYRLIVGHDVRGRHVLQQIMTETLVWCAIMIAFLALCGALVMRILFQHVVRSIARTTSAVAQGDLSHRIPLNGSETDLVATTVNAMLDRLKRLMDGVRQVSNAIAHDLRTPVARARTRLEDAALHARTETDLRNAITQALTDLDHITGIFEALLRIAQIEAGARRAAFAPLNVTPNLYGIAELYEASMEERGLKLKLDLQETPEIIGDNRMLQQAVANLLDNAVKFAPPGSTITLSARPLRVMEDSVPTGVEISVSDEGPGMSAADMARAHERFFRAENARSTPGSGLGLSLVQAVAALHRGQLSLSDTHPSGPFAPHDGTVDQDTAHGNSPASDENPLRSRGLRATLQLPLGNPRDILPKEG
ncbi:sensor histidine kinase [Oecophyllibacter saccharovorans]|uniref:histidine kinase n=1 Tax=Oecophyllibacter saccharovorans TaxID=2558360 RepID=A0A506URS2_9PROT|nr:HAMP domain-containing sensor histidine kinase [Oecophyllibacter saccharovorans]TPW36051.1 HAMP domain-containing histidine kinase [Oecophyllibacter saccharovorans]